MNRNAVHTLARGAAQTRWIDLSPSMHNQGIAVCFGHLDETTLTETNLHDATVQAMIKRIRVGAQPGLR